MATTGIPSTDSVELKFTLPPGITSATELKINLTNPLGEAVSDAEPSISIDGSAYSLLPASRKFTVALGKRKIRIKVNFKRNINSSSNLFLDIVPLTNLDWFLEPSFRTVLVFKDNFVINNFVKPTALVIAEKEVGEVDCVFSYPLERPLSLQIKIGYITANSLNVSNLQLSVDNGQTYTDLGSNKTVTVPSGTERLKIKIPTKDDRIVTAADKRFEIIFTENNVPASTLINQNNKIAVSIRDTSDIPYGTLIRNYCISLDQWGLFANGLGGTYTELIKIDSFDCGFTYPVAGTVLVTFCAGTTRVSHIADGNGNYTKSIEGYDSPLCTDSYANRPITTTVTPTRLTGMGKDGSVLLNPNGTIFTALGKDTAVTQFGTMFGKWYFEVQMYLPQRVHKAVTLGFVTQQGNLLNTTGSDNKGWSYLFSEERKYHNGIKNSFVGRLEVKDRDVIGVLLDNETTTFSLSLNGINLGNVFTNLSTDPLLFTIGAKDDSWAYVNFGERGFKYPVPPGYLPGFGEIPNPPLPKGTAIRTYCELTSFVTVYADGRNSTYVTKIPNSVDCGWVDPNPVKGTTLSYFCKVTDRWKMVADGNNGSYEQFHEFRSPSCNYIKPVIPIDFTPSIWDKDRAHVYTTFDTSMTEANFKGKVYTDLVIDHGVWYVEFSKWDTNTYLGIFNDNTFHSSALLTGFFGFDPSTGNSISSASIVKICEPITLGKKIGISLDFLKQESAVYIDDVKVGIIKTGLNYPADLTKKYGFAASTKSLNTASVVEANFGRLIFNFTPSDHISGFGPSAVVFPRRGILLKDFCKDWELWHIFADGAGGHYSVFQVNDSPACGWYPDPPIGSVIASYCVGFNAMRKIATGNYGYRVELVRANDRACGYVPYGELLEWFCQGYTKLGKFSNGAGGHYIGIVQYDSVDCGSPIVPAGTVLREFCAGYTKVQHKANGSGGYVRFIVEQDSAACGFKIPLPNNQDILTPTKWQVPGNNVILSNNRRDASALNRDGSKTEYSTIFGKWYFELTVFIPSEIQKAPALGVANSTHSMANWLGSNKNGWAWWPHEGTRYNNDSQGFYNQGLKIKDGDIISVLLDLETGNNLEFYLNGSPLGVLYGNFPLNDPLFFVFNASVDSYLSANFGQDQFKYPVPNGYYPGFGELKNPPTARGTLITKYCEGFSQWAEYADGKFGTYITLVKNDSSECGWTPPTPPTGTVLGYYCTGFDRYVKKADGDGGFTVELLGINHVDCNYVPPPPAEMTTTFFDKAFAAPETVIEEDQISASIFGVLTSKDHNYSGLWYYEVKVKDLNTIIGFTETKTNYGLPPGKLATSAGWAIGHNVFIKNDIETPLDTPIAVAVGDTIGVYLDFVNETMKVSINGVLKPNSFVFPTPANTYYLAFGNYNPLFATNVKVSFSPTMLVAVPPAGYIKGWGTPSSRRTKKHTFNTYYCTGTTRYNRYHDGNGGYFGTVLEEKSRTCGYVPPPVEGTVLSYFCVGVARWGKVADGVGGTTDQMLEYRSTICGYKPEGTLLGLFCDGFEKFGKYSDGNFGFYLTFLESNSRDCGYNDGTNTNTGGGSTGSELDPNLPVTVDVDGLVFSELLFGLNQGLVFKDKITQVTTLKDHGVKRYIQVGYDDDQY